MDLEWISNGSPKTLKKQIGLQIPSDQRAKVQVKSSLGEHRVGAAAGGYGNTSGSPK